MLISAKTLGRSLFIRYFVILYFVIILAVFANYPYIITLAIPNVLQNPSSTTNSNHPPVANAGENQIVNESTTVTLYGLASDPDLNNTLSYSWEQISGPVVTLSKSNTTHPSFKAPSVSSDTELKFSLTVKDDKGGTAEPVFVTITVRHVNHNPIAISGNNQTVNPGYVVSLDGSGSKDPDSDTLSYSWIQLDGPPVKLNNKNTAIATFASPSNISKDTDLTFKLTVSDTKNTTGIATVKVSIKHSPLPNKTPIADAGIDQVVNASSTVQLDASKSKDPDGGNIKSYSWVQTEGPPITLNDANSQTPSFTVPIDISSDTQIKFTLIVTDDKGSTSNPGIVTVTVKAPEQSQSQQTKPSTSFSNESISGNMTSLTIANLPGNEPQFSSTEYLFVATWGSNGTGDGQLYEPFGIAVDSSGNVYVSENGNDRIQKFDSNGNFIRKWGSNGTGDGQLYEPRGIAVDSSGNVYVSDSGNNRIQKFDSNGNFIRKWGEYGDFTQPEGIAVDNSGNVYITDSYNRHIKKFAPSSN